MEPATMKGTPALKEGKLTKQIERETSRIPSDVFLYASLGMMALSLSCKLTGNDHKSLFFGQWVAPLLLFGIYNKIVKTHGHDLEDTGEYDELL